MKALDLWAGAGIAGSSASAVRANRRAIGHGLAQKLPRQGQRSGRRL
jgi:hypothetical protein